MTFSVMHLTAFGMEHVKEINVLKALTNHFEDVKKDNSEYEAKGLLRSMGGRKARKS